jgi:hypothetical protein
MKPMHESNKMDMMKEEAVEDINTSESPENETFQAIDSFVESLSPDELNYLRECLAEKDIESKGEKKEVVMDLKDFED